MADSQRYLFKALLEFWLADFKIIKICFKRSINMEQYILKGELDLWWKECKLIMFYVTFLHFERHRFTNTLKNKLLGKRWRQIMIDAYLWSFGKGKIPPRYGAGLRSVLNSLNVVANFLWVSNFSSKIIF